MRYWQKVDYSVAKKLDDAIPTIGPVTITSTWRAPSGAGSSGSLHKKNPCLAIDFKPKDASLWGVFRKLKGLAFKRIGIRPDAHMLHVDVGVEKLGKAPYYFYEPVGGSDGGPIEQQKLSTLQGIPGFDGNFSASGLTVGTAVASSLGIQKTETGKSILDPKLLIPIGFAAARFLIG